MNAAVRRALVTGAVTVVLWALSSVDVAPTPRSIFDPTEPAQTLSLLTLGVRPLLSAFMVIELVALLVPSLRRRRVGGPEARRPLRLAAGALGLLFAGVQLFGLARVLGERETPGGAIALLVLGVAAAWSGLVIVDRFGLGSGYPVAVVLLREGWQTLAQLARQVSDEAMSPGGFLLVFGGAAAVVAFLLVRTRRPTTEGAERLSTPVPISGLGMTASAGAVLALPTTLANFRVPGAESLARTLMGSPILSLATSAVLATAFTVLWSLLFFRPAFVSAAWKRWNPALDATSLELSARALLPTAIRDALLVNVPLSAVLSSLRLPSHGLAVAALPLALAVLDVLEEWSFCRRHGEVTTIWEVHPVYEIDALLRRLEAEGLHPFAKARHLRVAFQFFGPFIPVSILVPVAERERARAVVEAPATA